MRKAENLKVPGEPIIFHGWTELERVVLAVAEFPDGHVELLDPRQVKFVDKPF